MNETTPQHHQEQWVQVDFERAEIHPGDTPGSLILTVTGNTPSSSAAGCPVQLVPRTYVTPPQLWVIEVMWDRADAIFQTVCPFQVSLPLEGIRGTKGLEIVGHTCSQQLLYQ